jgi:hypothetical protein
VIVVRCASRAEAVAFRDKVGLACIVAPDDPDAPSGPWNVLPPDEDTEKARTAITVETVAVDDTVTKVDQWLSAKYGRSGSGLSGRAERGE